MSFRNFDEVAHCLEGRGHTNSRILDRARYSGYLRVRVTTAFAPGICDHEFMPSAAGAQAARESTPVLCVYLDGPLVGGDLLWECVLVLLKTHPATLLLLPFWLLR